MLLDSIFPGSVVFLKFVFKLTIEQQFSRLDFAKAMLSFPIDIAFLSFSFGSAVLLRSQGLDSPMKLLLAFPVLCAALAALVVAICRKSDSAFVADRNISSFLLAILG